MTDWWSATYFKDGEAFKSRKYPVKAQNDVYMVNADSEKIAEEIMHDIESGEVSRAELLRNAVNILNVIIKTPTFEKYINGESRIRQESDISKMTLALFADNVKANEKYLLKTDKGAACAVCIKAVSDRNELVQIPVKIYVNGNSAAVITAQGTNGEKETFKADFYMMPGENNVTLEYEEKSINIEKMEIYL